MELEFHIAVSPCVCTDAVDAMQENVDIASSARERLQSSAHLSLRALGCEHDEGILVLRGRVCSFYHKQLAQEAVRNVRGVNVIVNDVEVVVPNESSVRSGSFP